MAKKDKNSGVLAKNRKAFHEYHIEDTYEAGISLLGTEVKSIRDGRANLKESYVRPDGEELFLIDCHISPYSHGTSTNHEPTRPRKLLLNKREIRKLIVSVSQKGFTIVPLKFYLRGPLIKLQIGLAKGKQLFDKRETKKRKDIDRDTARQLRNFS